MDDILTPEQAGLLLHLSPVTVRRKAAAGELPGRKAGRVWRFSRRQLVAWIEAGDVDEDVVDAELALQAAERMADPANQTSVPWEQVKAALGL